MGKIVHDDVLDGLLNVIKNNATRISVCETQPTTYTEATSNKGVSGYKLAIKTITSANFTGPANGDTSGRKLTKNEDATITVDVTGSAQHIALSDSATSKLLLVTTCTTLAITAAATITIPAWDMEVADPS